MSGPLTIILPAPRATRWYEMQIAGMVGQTVEVNGAPMTVVFAGPLDGSPEEGASQMELIIDTPSA